VGSIASIYADIESSGKFKRCLLSSPTLPPSRAQVAASWKVWPLAHAINFALVPASQRILYINSIQIGYNMFLSVLGSRGA
jgi:hypothetical protein